MSVRITRLVEAPELDDGALQAAAERALEHGGRADLPLDVILTDDPTLAELHGRCLDDPTPTDVMSFDLSDDQLGPQGEVYASVDRARDVASRRGVSVARELVLYVVHGTLHLCGYDDHAEQDRDAMRAAERAVMDALGYAPDVLPHDE